MSAQWAAVLMAMVYGVYAGALVGIGLWGYWRRRPLVVSNLQLQLALVTIFGAIFLRDLVPTLYSSEPRSTAGLLRFAIGGGGLLLLVGSTLARKTWLAYSIVAVSPQGYRQGLLAALDQLGFDYDILGRQVRLNDPPVVVDMETVEWGSIAPLVDQNRVPLPRVPALAQAMRAYYASHRVELNSWPYFWLLLLGGAQIWAALDLAANGFH